MAIALFGSGFLAGFALSRCQPEWLSNARSSNKKANVVLGGQIRWTDAPSYLKKTVHREIRCADERVIDIGNRIGVDLRLLCQVEEGNGYLHPNLGMGAMRIPVTLSDGSDLQGDDSPLLDTLKITKARGYLLESTDGHSQETKLVVGGKLWLWRVHSGSGWRELESDLDSMLADTAENNVSP